MVQSLQQERYHSHVSKRFIVASGILWDFLPPGEPLIEIRRRMPTLSEIRTMLWTCLLAESSGKHGVFRSYILNSEQLLG